MQPVLIQTFGPPGCGKSTLSYHLVGYGLVPEHAVVSPDQMRLDYTGKRTCQEENGLIFRHAYDRVRTRLSYFQDVYVDSTGLRGKGDPDDYYQMAKMYGIKTIAVPFIVPPSVLRERNATREHPVPDDILERFIESFDTLLREGVDNLPGDVMSPSQVVNFLRGRIQ